MISGERGTRERILDVAEELLGDRGYGGTPLHLIAARVGVQKASLFHYFASKEDLYRAVLDAGLGETQQLVTQVLETETSPLEKVRVLVEAYVDLVAAHPHRTKIFLRQSLGDAPDGMVVPADSQRLLAAVVAFIRDGQNARVFAPIDPLALVLGVVGMVAFFFTSAPVLAPAAFGDPSSPPGIERVKRYVVEVVQRCLTSGDNRRAAAANLALA